MPREDFNVLTTASRNSRTASDRITASPGEVTFVRESDAERARRLASEWTEYSQASSIEQVSTAEYSAVEGVRRVADAAGIAYESLPKKKSVKQVTKDDATSKAEGKIIDYEVSGGYFYVYTEGGGRRYATVKEWLDYCKMYGKKPWLNMPAIKGMTADQKSEIMNMPWARSGVPYSENRCSYCGSRIQEVPQLMELHSLTGYCIRCATSDGRQFADCLHRDPKQVSPKTTDTIGVESECNASLSLILNAIKNGWGAKPDGSLRGLSIELVSPILEKPEFEKNVFDVFRDQKANLYNRCGLHTWIGSSHLDWRELGTLVRYVAAWQGLFTRMVSPTREPTREKDAAGRPMSFPRQFHSCPLDRDSIVQMFYGTNNLMQVNPETGEKVNRVKISKRCNDKLDERYPWLQTMYQGGLLHRYQWINFHGHMNRGAIEIRLHQGTVDPDKIFCWGMLWHHIVNEIKNVHPDKVMNANPLDLVPSFLKKFYEKRIEYYDRMTKRDVESQEHFVDYAHAQIIEGR